MNILFTVCGRAGSKGIKNKNIKKFLGVPLLFYTFSAIDLYCKMYADIKMDIALNTDSEQMITLVQEKIIVPIHFVKRNKELALDNSPKVPVIADTMQAMENKLNQQYDMIVDLDITSPLRTVEDINKLIEMKKNSEYDVVFSVTESRRNPYFNMVQTNDDGVELIIKSDFVARQQAPTVYDMNASMYAYHPEFLKSGKRMFDVKCGITKMMDTGILDLDHENDFELMQVIAAYLFDRKEEFGMIKENVKNILKG